MVMVIFVFVVAAADRSTVSTIFTLATRHVILSYTYVPMYIYANI